MQNHKAHVPVARAENRKALVPPADLWERLDAEVERVFQKPPKDSLSIRDFAEHHDITYHKADGMVERLLRQGVIKEVGRFGSSNARYFIMVEK